MSMYERYARLMDALTACGRWVNERFEEAAIVVWVVGLAIFKPRAFQALARAVERFEEWERDK